MAASLTARTLARPAFESAFEASAFIRAMLAFEAALAEAEAEEGLIAWSTAKAIAAACASLAPDVDALVLESKRSATLAVPLVDALRKAAGPEAGPHVHFGATSQDVLDTAMALCLKPCLEEADRSLEGAVRALARRGLDHRETPMAGRTLLQPAIAMSAGAKIARWALALAEDRERLAESQAIALAVQLGGPVGTRHSLGPKGLAIRKRVARRLGLADALPWHAHRNAWIDLLDRMALVVLSAGKIARDVSLLSQPEVGEMREAEPREGVGASSAMPHKRNPVACVHALAAATRMPGLIATLHAAGLAEHERALGGWQAELALVPEIASALGTSLEFIDTIAASLVVDPERMRANLAGCPAADRQPRDEAALEELFAELGPYLT